MLQLEWQKKARKQLKNIPAHYVKAIVEKVEELAKWPDIKHLDTLELTDAKNGERRLKVGNYRVIWILVQGTPTVISIEQVLRRTSRTYSN